MICDDEAGRRYGVCLISLYIYVGGLYDASFHNFHSFFSGLVGLGLISLILFDQNYVSYTRCELAYFFAN